MKRYIFAILGVFFVAHFGSTAILAHSGAMGVVKERMELMKGIGDNTKAIARMVTGKTAYDAAAVRERARIIADHAGDRIETVFPEGSIQAPSEAKAEIWQNWDEFIGIADELQATAIALSVSADKGQETARMAFGKMAATCKGCHTDFRAKK